MIELSAQEVDIVVLALEGVRLPQEEGFSEGFTTVVNLRINSLIEKFLEHKEELIDKDGQDSV